MNFLLSQLNAADRAVINEANAQTLDGSLAFMQQPSLDPATNQPTQSLGAPTSGAWAQYALWVDAACALWRCTQAGTPGAWVQVSPAIVDDTDPLTNIPLNYLIVTPSQKWAQFFWDGNNWKPVYLQPQ
jgi:hypothetical protein